MVTRRVAVIGAGIMGSASALFLARRGVRVVLYEAAAEPFSRASRWNEGKIHLGFMYAADPSMKTAERILPGGLAFRPLIEELLDSRLANITEADDTFIVHRDSVVSLSEMRRYFSSLIDLISSHPGVRNYLIDVTSTGLRELSKAELALVTDSAVVEGGFMVPERSISTLWVADRFVGALAADSRIESKTAMRVTGMQSQNSLVRGPYFVQTESGTEGPYDAVVNASWEGRLALDSTIGLRPRHKWSYRYRVSLFVRTRRPVRTASVLLCTGPFGDIKNYNDRDFYLSWYPSGLLVTGEAVEPPPIPVLNSSDRQSVIDQVFDQLGRIVPAARVIQSQVECVRLEGGWVFASGQGDLSDRTSTLHQRHRIGIERVGSYFSVDTGKYSVAPWLALRVADAIAS
jgi:glycine/D-amino acid oxidase-like deaminating enzyme